jgi:hypothetical protein
MRRWVGTIALAALVLGAAGTAIAGKSYDSKVTFKGYNLGFFEGRVHSSFDLCEEKRGVDVYEDDPATLDTFRDNLIGTDRTDNKGEWSVSDTDGNGGVYYAVARSQKGSFKPKPDKKKKKYTCPEAESKAFVRE